MSKSSSNPRSRAGDARSRRRSRWTAAALATTVAASLAAVAPSASAVPAGDEPGLTMRAFQLGQGISELCTLKPGQTPNVDQLKQVIDWDAPDDFGGLQDNFVVEALAHLSVETSGTYQFRLTSDDGSRLTVDDQVVVDNDGLHGEEAKEGSVTLTAGEVHDLRVDYFEAGGGERLLLQWMPPGATTFSVVPTSALSTEANVTRVTAPGFKQCEGQQDSAGDGLQLDGVNPAYDLVDLRPEGFEPQVTGLEWDGDDLLVLTWGGNGNDQGNVELGELYRLSGVNDAASPADVTRTRIAGGLKEPQGIKVVDGEIYISEKTGLIKLTGEDAQGVFQTQQKIADYPFDGNFHEFGFGMLYKDGKFHVNLSVSINLGGATTVPQGSYDRGTHITIDKETGEIDYVAGGLRTPHGMGWGPDGEIFVTDNQGGWLPASKLI
ncbi:MAG TPA: PA14 domain-containing protein, partial [Ornithinibacter sp.]|nr:PA14 domain-containing protein [Ornithinibacter sp.]